MPAYFVKSGTGGTTGVDWANAVNTVTAAIALASSGDTIYVHNTHSNLSGAAITWTLTNMRVICVDGGDATGASLSGATVGTPRTGAIESTNANFAFTVQPNPAAYAFVSGMHIKSGAGAVSSSADIIIGSNNGQTTLCDCIIDIDSNSSGALLALAAGNQAVGIDFRSCEFRFGHTSQTITMQAAKVVLYNCKVDSTTPPTTLFTPLSAASRQAVLIAHGCDFSASTYVMSMTGASTTNIRARFHNCVIPTYTTANTVWGGSEAEFIACKAADGTNGANILAYYYEDFVGVVEDSQTIYKATGGAQGAQDDGTATPYSLKMTPNAAVQAFAPLWTPWINVFVGGTGSKTVTMKVAHTESAVLKENEVFMQVEYYGGTGRVANSPHSRIEYDGAVHMISGGYEIDPVATGDNRTDDAVDDWTGLTSEKEHTLSATVTLDEQGYIRCRVGLAKETTNPVYVDPKITVS